MPTKKKTKPEPGPACSPTQAEHDVAVAHLRAVYEDHLLDSMAMLHNHFVAFVAESRLPLPQVLLVLEMLVSETIGQAKKKYLGEG